MVIAKIRIIK